MLEGAEVIQPGDLLIVLGGPALLIGLGGSAASSMAPIAPSVNTQSLAATAT